MAGIFDVLEKSAKKTQKSSKKAISQGKGQKISDAERRRRKKREEEERRRRQNQQRATQARTDTAKPKQEKPKSRPNATLYQQALQSQYNQKKPSDKTIKKAQTLYDKRQKEHQKSYDKSHGDLKSAAKTAQKISATGGYVQKHTAGKDGNKHQATSQMQKAMSRTMAAGETEKYFHSGKSVYENSKDKKGKHLYTKQQAKQVSDYWKSLSPEEKKKFIKKNYGKAWKELDKGINKEDEKLRKANDARVTKKDATAEEYQRLQNALRASNGRADVMEGMIGKNDMRNWASRTAYDYAKGGVATGAQGFIEGISFGDNTAPFNNYYSDAEKRAIEQGKESGAYTLGYMGGIGAQFAVNGIGALGSSLAKTGFKGGAKGLAKEAFQGGLKNMTKVDKKALAKQAGKEILADNIVSAPLDVLDAYKTALDTDGKFDPATFAKTYGLNVAMNTGIGGAMSGGGALYKGAKIKNAISLKNKLETGNPNLTPAERKLMNEINARQGKMDDTGFDQFDTVMGGADDLKVAQQRYDSKATGGVAKALENGEAWGSVPSKPKPKNVGYHAGDLGKAEHLGNQSGNRGTGHYGTGTYFFGDKEQALKHNAKDGKTAPQHEVDFDGYNLYRPKDANEGRAFHDALAKVNNEFSGAVKNRKGAKDVADIIKRYNNGDEKALTDLKKALPDDVVESYTRKAERRVDNMKAIADEDSVTEDFREIAEMLDLDPNSEEFQHYFNDFLENRKRAVAEFMDQFDLEEQTLREIEDDIKGIEELYSRAGNWTSDITKELKRFFPDKSEKQIAKALEKAQDELGTHIGKMSAYKQDSASTILMKELGYEGVDVRGMKGLDNSRYGSVIYDLKPQRHGVDGHKTFKLTGEPVSREYERALNKLLRGEEISIQEYLNIPEVRTAKKMEAEIGDQTFSINTVERNKQREEWKEKLLGLGSASGRDKDGRTVYNGIVEKGHRLDIVIGLPASGKTSTLVDPLSSAYKSRVLDCDTIKEWIPEFRDGLGDGIVHRESRGILDDVKLEVIPEGDNVVLPIVGNTRERVEQEIKVFKENGYSIHLHLVDTNPNVSAGRNLRRLVEEGRFVDLETTSFAYGDAPSKVYEELKRGGLLDDYTKVTNSGTRRGAFKQLEGSEDLPVNWEDNRRNRQGSMEDFYPESKAKRSENPKGIRQIEPTNKVGFSDGEKPKAKEKNWKKQKKDARRKAREEAKKESKAKQQAERENRYRASKEEQTRQNNAKEREAGRRVSASEHKSKIDALKNYEDRIARMTKQLSNAEYRAKKAKTAKARKYAKREIENLKKKIQRYKDSADVLRKEIENDVVVAGKGTKAERAVSTRPLYEGRQRVGTTQEAQEAYTRLQTSSINDINERYLNDELTPMEQKTIFGKELEYPDRADLVDDFDEKNIEAIRKWKDVNTKKKPAVVKAAKKPKRLKEEPKTETKAEKKSGETEKKSEEKKDKAEKKSEEKTESKGKKSEKKSSKKTKQEKSEAKQEKVFKEYTTKEKKEAIEKAVDEKFGETGEMTADDFLRMVKAEEDFANAVKDDRLLSETYKKLGAQLLGSVHDTERMFDVLQGIKESGAGNKRIFKRMSKAVEDAKKDVDKDFDTVYSRVMGAELADDGVSLKKVDPYAYSAESAELLEVLTRRFNETGSLDDLHKIMELTKKNIATNSERGHALRACQALYRETPTGRYHLALSELNRLNKKFADRLDKPLELTDDEIKAIFHAETEEEIDACFKAINLRVWEDIPSTWFEKFNEFRHMTMLANPKTHARNLIGNGVFFLARSMSDAMEVRLMKSVAKHVKDKDHTFVMATSVKRSEVKKHKEFVDNAWKQWYKDSNTRSRFIETQRPDGSTEIRLVPVKKLVNFNYKLLELEDLKFLQPEFNKELVRYCKAHNIPMDGTASKKAMDAARAYAGNKAQVATYRDVSTLSNILTGWKQKTASRTGKTALGTMGYRAANMVLESQLPFVKTPVNIFRRMMDYSPGGLLKSAADMHRFVTKGDYDSLADSVHYFCTGLTGSGVMLGGAWLAQQGLLMTNAGVMSGDEFYDRDMGFQDYSAMIPEVKLPNGTLLWDKRSLSLDWVAPMATSLFMGATAYEQLSEKGFEMDDITKALGAIANPMMEMSFMSSSKDLIETFLENAVDRATGETHWTDAAFNALAGSIPQGYLTSIFSAQLLAQGAQASDKYNRDTSSTLDGSVAKSWDRWRKQIINRIPVARQLWLEKKVDRRGRDSETVGDNVVTKFLHAFINPSATRKITFDDTDREIIKIYNEMPDNTNTEKKKKSFFFYNFTGNPSYDLGNGRRMTNKEKYEYTKENRHQHNLYIKQMIKDKAYNDMTPSMKAAEIDDAHWLATTVADRKVFGDDYAIKKVLGKSSSATDVAKSAVTGEASGPVADREAYDSVMYGAKSDKAKKQAKRDFLNFYIMKEKTVMQTHDSSYYTKAIAVSAYKEQQKALGLDSKNAEKMALAYNIYDSKMQTSDEYFKKGGSMDEYTSAMRRVMSGINIMGASTSQRNKAVSAGTYKKGLINERTRKAFGLSSDMSNMGYGLAQKFDHKYTLKELNAMNTELKMRYNKDKNSSLSKEEIVNYIDSLEKKQGRKISQEEKACLYRYFYTYQSKVNPYGKIPNFLGGEDTSDGTGGYGRRGWGRRGHRGWGHRGHRGGGGGGGEGAGSYAAWLKKNGYITGGTSGQSALTEAFRKRQLKNLQSTTGRVKGK